MVYVFALLVVCARSWSLSAANNVTFEDVIFQELPQKTSISPRSACSIGTFNDTIFILGGILESAKIDGTIWAYDMKNNTWTIKCPTPCIAPYHLFPIAGACSVQDSDTIYVFGGVNESGHPNVNLYGYNMSSNSLTILSDINRTKAFPTTGLSCSVNQGAIYFYANDSLFSYDLTSRNWTLHNVAGNPGNREGSSLISYENNLVLFGGTTDEHIWIFSLDESKWTNKTVPGPKPGPRSNHLAAYDYTRIGRPQMIVYGGDLEKDVTFGDLWSYDFKNNSWKQFYPKITPGSREKTNYISSYGRIIIYGGEHNLTASFSDLWVLVIEADCYSYGWDCFKCAQSIGCGWCNSNPVGYQCVAGHDYAYINYTCNNTSNNFLNNFTKDYLMCPIVGFPGWIVALLTLAVPILIGLVIWLYHYFTHRSKMPSSDFVAINVDEGTPIIRHEM